MAARRMLALFPSRCARCGQQIGKGAAIMYDKAQPKGQRVWHVACNGEKAPEAPQQQPAPRRAPAAADKYDADDLEARFPRSTIGAYDSVEAYMAAALRPKHPERGCWRGWYDGKASPSWCGLSQEFPDGRMTLPQMCEMVSRGWTRGADRIMEALAGIPDNLKPRSVRRVRRWADQGDAVEMSRVWAGRLDVAWQRCTREQRIGPAVITLVNDALESCAGDHEAMFWRGAALVALADKLTAAGYNVRIVSAWSTLYDGERLTVHCVVKQPTAPLDLPALAAAVANPGFFRAIGHAWGNGNAEHNGGPHARGFQVRRWPAHPGEILAPAEAITNATSARDWIIKALASIQGDDLQAAA